MEAPLQATSSVNLLFVAKLEIDLKLLSERDSQFKLHFPIFPSCWLAIEQLQNTLIIVQHTL